VAATTVLGPEKLKSADVLPLVTDQLVEAEKQILLATEHLNQKRPRRMPAGARHA
jgi:hypothetical protein